MQYADQRHLDDHQHPGRACFCTLRQALQILLMFTAGLLLSAIRDPDPVVFFEAKMLYRTVSEEVPIRDYMIPLGEARITRTGSDITLVGWGQQVAVLERAVRCKPFLCKQSQSGTCLCLGCKQVPKYTPSIRYEVLTAAAAIH